MQDYKDHNMESLASHIQTPVYGCSPHVLGTLIYFPTRQIMTSVDTSKPDSQLDFPAVALRTVA